MTSVTLKSVEVLPRQRQAGIGLHITSLPGNYGIGEIGDAAREFIDAMVRMNLRVWQFLPLGPTAYGDSPYQPLSTFAGNELLIDTASLIRTGLLTSIEADSMLGLHTDFVDYGALIPRKKALLQRAAGRFEAQANSAVKSDFDRFLDRHDARWLNDYAMYRVLKAHHDERSWPEWAAAYVHRDSTALHKLQSDAASAIANVKIIQFLFHWQWRQLRDYAAERGVLLFGDLPIYIALDSSDAWANRNLLSMDGNGRPGFVAGVPPDYFSEEGQLWGNPLYDWDRHARTGYRWWIERLRHSAEFADIVRIDHFRGFESYWSVPFGATSARAGEWLPGPRDAIFDAMNKGLGQLPIVAEDLGVITPAVDALRERHRIPGMKVLQFEVGNDNFNPGDIDEDCVCYTGTHDNDTTLGWFRGNAQNLRDEAAMARTRKAVLEITGGQSDTVHNDLIGLAFSTRARLAIAPLQDYLGLGSEARMNTPGTSAGNWRWRMRAEQLAPSLMDATAQRVDDSGRRPVR
ncbi:MAG: 4-alpha-glucanotransferase [Woeseiaceae bacterium]|nr:4-alpha-glucanotransferase [Woeseiaceae bacterium]